MYFEHQQYEWSNQKRVRDGGVSYSNHGLAHAPWSDHCEATWNQPLFFIKSRVDCRHWPYEWPSTHQKNASLESHNSCLVIKPARLPSKELLYSLPTVWVPCLLASPPAATDSTTSVDTADALWTAWIRSCISNIVLSFLQSIRERLVLFYLQASQVGMSCKLMQP